MRLAFRRLTMASLLALLAATPEAAAWDWKQVDSKEGRMSLSSGRVMPEGVERGVDRDAGSLFMAEFAWWGFENQGGHQIEAGLYWTEDRGGWDIMHVGRDAFFDEFSTLDEEWIETGATEGPTISTSHWTVTVAGSPVETLLVTPPVAHALVRLVMDHARGLPPPAPLESVLGGPPIPEA